VTKRRAIVGANMPWIGDAYGHDLGRNQAHPDWPVEFDPDRLSKLFAVLREFGVRHVRLWLFEDAEGLLCTGEGLVDGLDQAFLDNLRVVALLAEQHDMRIYWTLLDANSLRRRPDMITRRILSQDDAASVFFDKAVAPISRSLRPPPGPSISATSRRPSSGAILATRPVSAFDGGTWRRGSTCSPTVFAASSGSSPS
jgi:hypothetical protein